MTPSSLAWLASGQPPHGYREEPAQATCATCAAAVEVAVPLTEIETPTTANHADLFRFGSRHVCSACAWLYAAGKGRPGNYLATPNRCEYLVVSVESVVAEKRPWLAALPELAALPAETPIAGVMTTDVKPRLWPRTRVATVGAFGLYVHAPDYDVSEWRSFDLRACLTAVDAMLPALRAGFAKASIWHGLMRDHARRACNWRYHGKHDRAQDGVLIDGVFKPGRSCVQFFGTRSPEKLRALMPHKKIEPHYDEGKHCYWLPLGTKGEAKARRLNLTHNDQVKPGRFAGSA